MASSGRTDQRGHHLRDAMSPGRLDRAVLMSKRCLFVIHYPVFGGPHNQALRLAPALRSLGWEMIVLIPDEPGNAAERLRAAGVQTVEAPLGRLRASGDPRLHLRFVGGFYPEIRRIRSLIRQLQI